jgi:hypothetical protein
LKNLDADDFMAVLLIDIDVLSIADGEGFDRGDVRSGFGLSIDIAVLSIAGGGRIRS